MQKNQQALSYKLFWLAPLISFVLNTICTIICLPTGRVLDTDMMFYGTIYVGTFPFVVNLRKLSRNKTFHKFLFLYSEMFVYIGLVIMALFDGQWLLLPSAKEWMHSVGISNDRMIWLCAGINFLCIGCFLAEVVLRLRLIHIWSFMMALFYLFILIYNCSIGYVVNYVVLEQLAAIIYHCHIAFYKEYLKRISNTSHINNKIRKSDKYANNQKISTDKKIDLIYGTVIETNVRTKFIADNLSSLITFVEYDLSSTLRKAKDQIRENTAEVESDKLPDETVSAFIEKISEYINQNTKSSEVLFDEETKHLAALFGQAWDKLLPTSKTSLISAGVLWKSCAEIKDNEDFDFSGICISATSALENELKRHFFIGFQKYLEKNYGTPSDEEWEETFKNWPEIVLSTTKYEYERSLRNPAKFKRPSLNVGTNFTLGSVPFVLGVWRKKNMSDDQFSLLLDRMDEYLQTIVKERYRQNARIAFVGNGKEDSFVNKCERIRLEYRNKAAHVDVVTRRQAEGCYRAVIGKMDAYDHTTNITGALLELFSILK